MFRRKKPNKRIVFTLTLEHRVTEEYEEIENYGVNSGKRVKRERTFDNLSPNCEFSVKRRNRHNDEYKENGYRRATYGDVRDFCEKIINDEISNEIQEMLDLPIHEVKVIKTHEGSLIVFFSVVFDIYQFVAGISGVHATVKLIEKTVKMHMQKRLADEFYTNGYFDVNVNAETETRHDDIFNELLNSKNRRIFTVPLGESSRPKRDALFWYLLVSNIVLITIVVLLVGNAVVKTYW